MDILLLMLLIWGYNEQPKDAQEEEPEIVGVKVSLIAPSIGSQFPVAAGLISH